MGLLDKLKKGRTRRGQKEKQHQKQPFQQNLSQKTDPAICPGGAFRRRTSSFADQHTIDMLRTYHADRAFISCPKLTVEYGLSDNHLSEARVRETMLKQSQERYLIVDHTKFNSSANILFEGLELVDMIITDQKLDEDWERYIASRGIKVEYCTE